MKFTINNNFLSKALNLKDDTSSLNNNIKSFHKRIEKEPLDKLSFINRINNLKNDNNSETFEKLIKEEADRIKIPTQKKEHLKNIDLIENHIPSLYNWKNLFNKTIPINRYISLKKNNLYNQDDKNKIEKEKISIYTICQDDESQISHPDNLRQKNSKNKSLTLSKNNKNNKANNIYNNIDYSKGRNVLCNLPNEFLINFYKDIIRGRKFLHQTNPKFKLKKSSIRSDIKNERILSFNKQIKLNILITDEIENGKFKNEDLIITAKRKNVDSLVKTFFEKRIEELDENTKKYFRNTKKHEKGGVYKSSKNIFRKRKKTKRLILSTYDENSPCLNIFKKHIIENNNENNKITDNVECEIIKPTLKRNIFSASNINSMNIYDYNQKNENPNINIYDYNERKTSNENEERKRIIISNNFFKTNEAQNIINQKSSVDFSNQLNRPMSSFNLKTKNHSKYGFTRIDINEFENNLPYKLKAINYIQSFPKRSSSKVGNIIFDKINKMLKSKQVVNDILKTKKQSKKYFNYKTSISNSNNFDFSDEESKGNKTIKIYNDNSSKKKSVSNRYNKNTNYNYFFEDDYKYENAKNMKKAFDTKTILKNVKKEFYINPLIIHNKLSNKNYSCSNNYIITNKRKKKNKFLKDYKDNDSLHEILSEILSDDK